MLRILLSAPLSLLAVIAAAQDYTATVKTTTTKVEARAWIAWKNAECSLNYPGAWTAEAAGPPGTVVIFSAPMDSSGFIQSKVDLVSRDIGAMSLEDFMRQRKAEIKAQFLDGHFIGGVAQSDGQEASQTLEYTGTINDQPFHYRQVVRVNKGKAYLLTYSATDEMYDESLFMAEAMFGSFKVQ